MAMFPRGSVAFITGAASGIGAAIALQLAKDGIENLALVDISASGLMNTSLAIENLYPNHRVLELSADCTVESNVDYAVDSTVEEFGRIDVAVNAAGIACDLAKMEDQSMPSMERVLDVNLKGVWLCERAVIKQMLKQEMRDLCTGLPCKTRGSIVNIGSVGAVTALGSANPYTMAKHGVMGLTRADGFDYAAEGIRVNCVCPGWIQTPLLAQEVWESESFVEMFKRIPVKRLGLPEEVAFTVSFLASDRASYSNGSPVVMDGGWVL